MARQYRSTLLRRLGNKLIAPALKLGLGPARLHLLTVTGRKSGRRYTTPVNLVYRGGEKYLVAPYGEVSWVRNARPAGEVSLRRGRKVQTRRIEALAASEALPVLRDYWRQNAITRPFFEGRPEDEAFARDAPRHPVFRLS
jgi:deazaflavin-dependent oxidoreductase (nitroreductase family)